MRESNGSAGHVAGTFGHIDIVPLQLVGGTGSPVRAFGALA